MLSKCSASAVLSSLSLNSRCVDAAAVLQKLLSVMAGECAKQKLLKLETREFETANCVQRLHFKSICRVLPSPKQRQRLIPT